MAAEIANRTSSNRNAPKTSARRPASGAGEDLTRRPGTERKPERFRPYAARRQERRQEGRREAEAAVEGAIEKQKAGQHISSNAHARRSMSYTARL